MTYVFYLYFIYVNAIEKHKKGIQIFLILLFMLLISAGCYRCADYFNYRSYYETGISTAEKGWMFLTSIFKNIGIPFETFRLLLFTVFVAIIYIRVRDYTENVFDILFLYLIYPFMWDIVQMRNAAVLAILLISFKYLLVPGWKNDLKYIVLICIASSFHTVALWYLLYIPAKYIKKKKRMMIAVIIMASAGCILAYSGGLELLINKLISRERTLRYFRTRAHLGVILSWVMMAGPMFVFLLFHERYNQLEDEQVIRNDRISIRDGRAYTIHSPISYLCVDDILLKINCINLLTCVLVCFNIDFYRIVRNVLIFNYMYVFHVISINKNHDANYRLKVIIAILCFLIFAGNDYIKAWEGVPASVMKYNYLNDTIAEFLPFS